jgi:hypothetical protein
MARAVGSKTLETQAMEQGSTLLAEVSTPCNGHQITSVSGSSSDLKSLKIF